MQLYDKLIENLYSYVKALPKKSIEYSAEKTWPESDNYELVLQRDTALELGADGFDAVNGTYVSDNEELYSKLAGGIANKVLVYGDDIASIRGNISYGRIALILINKDDKRDTDTDSLYTMLGDMDFVKYHIHPKGFMVRTSSQSQREQVRISKEAVKDGICFEGIGNSFISHYLKKDSVKNASICFITSKDMDFAGLASDVNKGVEIRNSLSKIRKGIPTECSVCEIKDICDDVKGLKELHFGKKSK